MTTFSASMDRDANYRTIETNEAFLTSKTVTFNGASGNGAIGTINLFTVTGHVLLRFLTAVTETCVSAGGGTLSLGVVGSTTSFLGASLATSFEAGDVAVSAGSDGPIELLTTYADGFFLNNADIIGTVGTGNITDGTLVHYVLWRPLSSDGKIEAV